MGAQAFAERARRELVATGEKVRKQPVSSGDELTAQETQIARLAGDGLTNQEIGAQLFISTHTVEWHLRRSSSSSASPRAGSSARFHGRARLRVAVGHYGLRTTDYGLPRVRFASASASLISTDRINWRFIMKIVVIGGTGLIGSKVVAKLTDHGHEAIAAAPNTGVNTLTGEGLAEALTGAQVVVDVSNSPSFEDGPAWDFFTTATGNVLNAAESAGVSHLVALSVVGTDRLLDSGYFRAKDAQEQLITEAAIPFSIVRATQFFEFVGRIADSATDGDTVRISSAPIQPMAADDVATAVARTAVGQPVGGILEVGGPDRYATRRPRPRPSPRAGRHPRRRHRSPVALLRRRARRPHLGPRRHRDGVRHPLRGLARRQRGRSGPG